MSSFKHHRQKDSFLKVIWSRQKNLYTNLQFNSGEVLLNISFRHQRDRDIDLLAAVSLIKFL